MNDFASSADSIAEKLIAGGMDPDQAMMMALRMSQSREQASILGGVPVSPPVSDVPPVEEPILGGDTSKMFQRQPTIGQRLRDLPKDFVGAGEALASLGSAAALAPASMLYALRPGQQTQGSPLEFAMRNMYIPRTERGISHLQGLGEVLESLPQTGPLPELQAFTGLTRGIGTQLGQKARQAGEAMAPKVADVSEEFLRRQGLLMDVVRPKGTQVIGGNIPESIDTQLKQLQSRGPAEQDRQWLMQHAQRNPEAAETGLYLIPINEAINKWVERNLGNYIKKQMGTPDDPVRQLAESGVTHIQERYNEPGRITRTRRTEAGFPEEGMGVSPEARSWENLSDRVIDDYLAGSIQPQAGYMKDFEKLNEELNDLGKKVRERFFNERTERLIRQGETPERAKQYINDFLEGKNNLDLAKELNDPQLVKDYSTLRAKRNYAQSLLDPEYASILRENPWIERLDPNTRLYTARTEGLQFDHVIDVLRDDLDSGRIRPEQLNRVSVADAVRRTYEFDQEMAKKAEQAQAELANKLLNESPFKTYDNGFKWVKLPDPAASDESMKTVRDIGCQGGWCTQSESNALYYGAHAEGNNLYVLMSPDKRVHAQIHVQSPEKPYDFDALMSDPQSKARASQAVREWRQRNPDVNGPLEDEQVYRALREAGIPEASPTISEIKPRANSWQSQMVADQIEKNPEYQQTIQRMLADFVKSTKYPVEYDLENTGLFKVSPGQRLPGFSKEIPPGYYTLDDFRKMAIENEMPQEILDSWMQKLGERYVRGFASGGLVSNNNQIALGRESVQKPIPYKQGGSVNHKAVESARKAIEKALAKGGAVKMAGGGSPVAKIAKAAAGKKSTQWAQEAAAAKRSPAKSKEEIEAIARRMAAQTQPGFVRASEEQSINPAGKSQLLYEMEQRTPMVVESTIPDRPVPNVDYEKQLGKVIVGVPGDPTMGQVATPGSLDAPTRGGKQLVQVGNIRPETPVQLYGGPRYGANRDDVFWASNLSPARAVQNLVQEMAEKYGAEQVLGKYIKMSPESSRFAMHNLDALISVLQPEKLDKDKIELLNSLVRKGNPKNKFPEFAGFENPIDILLQAQMDSKLRKQISEVLEKPTVAKQVGFPFPGKVVQTAITEPELRNVETGVTGFAMGKMSPEEKLTRSTHPTYEYDIPGQSIGRSKYLIPSELSFPDFMAWYRSRPDVQAKVDPINMMKSYGPRQVVDQQYIDEIKMYEEAMKKLTGKKKGGLAAVKRT